MGSQEPVTTARFDIGKRLNEACLPLMEAWLAEILAGGDELLRAIPEDDLRVYAFMLVKRFRDFLGGELGADDQRLDFRKLMLSGCSLIVDAVDAQANYTEGRSIRVAQYSARLAGMLRLKDHDIDEIQYAARIHNLGLINASQRYIGMARTLSASELNDARNHSHVGADILKPIEFLFDISNMVRYHHANWDGSGYPSGAGGEQIPLGARIIRIADAFEAMMADRPQRPAMSRDEAFTQILRDSGRAFDPGLVRHAGAML
jgi:response regulator RpfG family c-di-GMP phosphodiesterase